MSFAGFKQEYPETRWDKQIDYMLLDVTGRLARHELYVARFYLKRDNFEAAAARARYALRTYENSGLEPEALVLLGETYLKMKKRREARDTFNRLIASYPASPFVLPARAFLEEMGRSPREVEPWPQMNSTPPPDVPLAPVSPMVLVVDDEKNIRLTVEMVLTGEGYRVTGAASAEDALGILAQPNSPVDLVLLDVKLPGMSGLEMLERVRNDEGLRELPVIVISGHATVHDAVTAIKLGASDFFEKPLNRDPRAGERAQRAQDRAIGSHGRGYAPADTGALRDDRDELADAEALPRD